MVRKGGVYEYDHIVRPVAAASATTVLGGCTEYKMPFTTSGVASNFSYVWACHVQASSNRAMDRASAAEDRFPSCSFAECSAPALSLTA
jgi:hypothetical protein